MFLRPTLTPWQPLVLLLSPQLSLCWNVRAGITQYVAFPGCLLSLSFTLWRCLHVFQGLTAHLLFFFPLKNFQHFLQVGMLTTNSFGFCLPEKVVISPSLLKGRFPVYRILAWCKFSLNTNYFSLFTSYLHGFWGAVRCNFCFCSFISKVCFFFPPCSSIKILSLSFIFCNLKMTSLGVGTLQVMLVINNPPANAGDMRHGFDPWVRKIPWRRARQPTPVFLSGESHGQRSLAG